MTFQIDNDIPVPAAQRSGPVLATCRKLDVGQSFVVPLDGTKQQAAKIMTNLRSERPKRFATRTVETGIRIWRIA